MTPFTNTAELVGQPLLFMVAFSTALDLPVRWCAKLLSDRPCLYSTVEHGAILFTKERLQRQNCPKKALRNKLLLFVRVPVLKHAQLVFAHE